MEDELIKIWQSSPNQEQIKFEKSKLIIDVQSSLDRLHKAIKYRDLMETVPAILLIPMFAYQVYAIPFMLSKIASIWIVLWIAYVVFRLRRAKKNKPGAFTESYINYLHESKKYLLVQKNLLDNIFYWYISPGLFGVILFIIGASLGGRFGFLKLLFIIVGVICLGIGVYFLNKRAVKRELDPRLRKIDELIKVMEE